MAYFPSVPAEYDFSQSKYELLKYNKTQKTLWTCIKSFVTRFLSARKQNEDLSVNPVAASFNSGPN